MSGSRYAEKIRKVLGERPDETAIDFDGAPFTWREAAAVAGEVEHLLDQFGVPPFGRVGLLGRNRPLHFATLWGIFIAGRCMAMVHAFQPLEALAEDIAANRWPILFGEARDWTTTAIAAAESAGTVGFEITDDPHAPFQRVTARVRPSPDLLTPPGDVTIVQLLSSGTTGRPKRISLSLHAIDDLIERTRFQFGSGGSGESAPQLLPWPLSSLGGTNAALPAATLGQTLVIQERFDAPRFLEQLRKYRPSFLSMPAAAMAMLLQLDPSREDLACVKLYFNGAAPLDPNVRRRMEDEYGLPVANAYGATEFAGIISSWAPEDFPLLNAKRGSCGRALPGMRMRIVAPESGEVLPPGEVGLVEALVPRVSDQWVRTNDLAFQDEDGFLFLQGRADDAIIRGGFKVIPEEVAEVLRLHRKVGDAALIGIPDERLGMVPAAAVEKRADSDAPTPEELDAFLRTRLPAWKLPVRYAIVAEIPRTPSMKPRREGLRDLFA
jgi:acyl-CoA synthetase (AMP-forming)/AMP-acid ligase II